jgi:hypothetical protein
MASSTWCTEIKESIENDSTWTPTIYIPTTKWSKEDAKSNTFIHVHEDIVYLDSTTPNTFFQPNAKN